MTSSKPKLKKGLKAFVAPKRGKFFHRDWTLLTPFYPQHADAYKLAADTIIDAHLAAPKHPHNDRLLYPVLYLYRHCLELKMKDVVRLGVRCGHFKASDVKQILGRHWLDRLWERAKDFLAANGCHPTDLTEIENVVKEFITVDEDGNTLRYDRDTQSKLREYKNIPTHIWPSHLRNTMETVYNYLESNHAGITDYHSQGD